MKTPFLVQDDWARCHGVLLALSNVSEELTLLAKQLLADEWLQTRARRNRLWRNLSYIW